MVQLWLILSGTLTAHSECISALEDPWHCVMSKTLVEIEGTNGAAFWQKESDGEPARVASFANSTSNGAIGIEER
jgi:hypothetical protein